MTSSKDAERMATSRTARSRISGDVPSRARKAAYEHPHYDALKEKAHEEKVVRGRTLSASDIFKFVGFVAFFVIMVVICALIWPYVRGIFEPGGLERVMDRVQSAGPGGVMILLVMQFLQIVVAFIPGEVVQVAAGMLYGPWLGALVILAGCVVSSAFIFVVVHKLGAPFVQDMVPTKYLDKFRRFESSGKLNTVVFVLFLIPGLPKDVFTYLVPLTGMRMSTFLLLSNIGRIPGIVVSTYAAAGIIEGDYVKSAVIFAIAALVAVAGILGYDRIMRYFERRSGGRQEGASSVSGKAQHSGEGSAKRKGAVQAAFSGPIAQLDSRDYETRTSENLEGGAPRVAHNNPRDKQNHRK